MSLDLRNEIDAMINDRKMDEEQVLALIEDMIKSAYKRKYGTDENVKVVFSDDKRTMSVFQVRKVVEEENWYSEFTEIPVEDAEEIVGHEVSVGEEVEIELDPKSFESSSVQSAKQRGQQIVKEYYNDKVYADAKRKEGKLIYGEITREREDRSYLVNLNMEIEAVFPYRAQSPRETYQIQQKYKFLVERVEKADAQPSEGQEKDRRKGRKERGVRIFLTRASKDFVKALIENEVPEIGSGDVEIKAIARQAGMRTKIAVDSKKSDVDPVGAVVGAKGSRIQTVKTECEGEMIDVVRYSSDPLEFVANALIPAQVDKVVIIDAESRHVVAVVDENQLGLAIGQGGVNVKLAKAITDWNIEVKTPAQFEEMSEIRKIYTEVEDLFGKKDEIEEVESEEVTDDEEVAEAANEELVPDEGVGGELEEDEMSIDELSLGDELTNKLKSVGIFSVQKFFDLDEEQLKAMGLSDEDIKEVNDSVEIEEEDEFECPNCHQMVPEGSTVCPFCGAEFEFE